LLPWPKGKTYACINNFGLGGTNAHVVLKRAPILGKSREIAENASYAPGYSGTRRFWPRRAFILTANREDSVRLQAEKLAVYIEKHPELFDNRLLENLSYTLGQRRTLLPWRVAVSAKSAKELIEQLSETERKPYYASRSPNIGFVFTGQGAQWYAMGRELFDAYPVFSKAMTRAETYLASIGATFSLRGSYIT
jgi:acyl transferase domain-containing protein